MALFADTPCMKFVLAIGPIDVAARGESLAYVCMYVWERVIHLHLNNNSKQPRTT